MIFSNWDFVKAIINGIPITIPVKNRIMSIEDILINQIVKGSINFWFIFVSISRSLELFEENIFKYLKVNNKIFELILSSKLYTKCC